jgi:DNA-binding Xre family transcriptional regulator
MVAGVVAVSVETNHEEKQKRKNISTKYLEGWCTALNVKVFIR